MIEEALLSFSFAIIQIDCDSYKLDKHYFFNFFLMKLVNK